MNNTDKNFIMRDLNLTSCFAVLVGYLYLVGYLINTMFIRNVGISRIEFAKLQYIETGLIFSILTISLAILPLGAFILTYNTRRKSDLPDFWLGFFGNAFNAANFCLLLVFFAVFVIDYEWKFPLQRFGGLLFQNFFFIYMVAVFIGIAGLPAFERVAFRCDIYMQASKSKKSIISIFIEVIRYGVVVYSIYFDYVLVSEMEWMGDLLKSGFPYILTIVVHIIGIYVIVYWYNKVPSESRKTHFLGIIAIALATLFYMTVASYVYGVYRFIPMNRGGKFPVTEAVITFKDAYKTKNAPESLKVDENNFKTHTLYIIEENDDFIFVTPIQEAKGWTKSYRPTYGIRKAVIDFIEMKRIKGKGARGNN